MSHKRTFRAFRDSTNIGETANVFGAKRKIRGTQNEMQKRRESAGMEVDPLQKEPVRKIPDIDEIDKENPLWVSEYAEEIYNHLYVREKYYMPNDVDYMNAIQRFTLKPSYRTICNNWIVEVVDEFDLRSQTLHLAINYADRFMAKKAVQRSKLQLVAITCMFIASKYEEVETPHIQEFVDVCADAYTKSELILMERTVANVLKFEFTVPTPKDFLKRFLKAANADLFLAFLSNYFVDMSVVFYEFVPFRPSVVAAAAVRLAMRILGRGQWNEVLEHYSRYEKTDGELNKCYELLYRYAKEVPNNKFKSVYTRYCHSRFLRVAMIPIR